MLFVFGVSVTTQPGRLRSYLGAGLAVEASALNSFFLAIVQLGWVDPLFGQQAVDLGFKSVVALPGKRNLKSRTLPTPPLARRVGKPDYQFPNVQEKLRQEVEPGEWLQVFPGVVALADRLEGELCGP
jgi:hypothetical protein